MKPYLWVIVFLLIFGCILGVTLGIVLTRTASPEMSPVPSTSIFPFPSLTMSPVNRELVLLYDTFDGPADQPLTLHVPNAPVGIYWVPYAPYADYFLRLTGSGAASNLASGSESSLLLSGANITSGQFTSLGYRPKTDTLEATVTLTLPTITPRPSVTAGLIVAFALSRTLPQNDVLAWALEYKVRDPPTYSFTATTNRDVGGLNSSIKTIINTGTVSGDPSFALTMTFSITPDGVCTVTCPQLSINAQGPNNPDIIPKEGFAMHSFSMFVLSDQDSTTSGQPLNVLISEVQVTAGS